MRRACASSSAAGGDAVRLGAIDASALDQDVFLPMSVLNELRRQAVAELLTAGARASGEMLTVRQVAIDATLAGLPQSRPRQRNRFSPPKCGVWTMLASPLMRVRPRSRSISSCAIPPRR